MRGGRPQRGPNSARTCGCQSCARGYMHMHMPHVHAHVHVVTSCASRGQLQKYRTPISEYSCRRRKIPTRRSSSSTFQVPTCRNFLYRTSVRLFGFSHKIHLRISIMHGLVSETPLHASPCKPIHVYAIRRAHGHACAVCRAARSTRTSEAQLRCVNRVGCNGFVEGARGAQAIALCGLVSSPPVKPPRRGRPSRSHGREGRLSL
jgi:hypothetical protein